MSLKNKVTNKNEFINLTKIIIVKNAIFFIFVLSFLSYLWYDQNTIAFFSMLSSLICYAMFIVKYPFLTFRLSIEGIENEYFEELSLKESIVFLNDYQFSRDAFSMFTLMKIFEKKVDLETDIVFLAELKKLISESAKEKYPFVNGYLEQRLEELIKNKQINEEEYYFLENKLNEYKRKNKKVLINTN